MDELLYPLVAGYRIAWKGYNVGQVNSLAEVNPERADS